LKGNIQILKIAMKRPKHFATGKLSEDQQKDWGAPVKATKPKGRPKKTKDDEEEENEEKE
jgi:hypothetical protein